jgi:hypothetical protein
MQKFIILGLAAALALSCSTSNSYAPEKHLITEEAEKQFLLSIIRYTGRMPKKATSLTKYDATFQAYYEEEISYYEVEKYHVNARNEHYFLVSRPARSLHEKRVATGGKLTYDSAGQISYYEEVFRTWKMKVSELEEKSSLLFDLMVKGKDLSAYYPQNSEEEWVEFPDDKVYYNTMAREWRLRDEIPLEEAHPAFVKYRRDTLKH